MKFDQTKIFFLQCDTWNLFLIECRCVGCQKNEQKNELECVGEFLCFSLSLPKSIEVQSEFLPINNSEAAYKSIACQENRSVFLRGALRINLSTAQHRAVTWSEKIDFLHSSPTLHKMHKNVIDDMFGDKLVSWRIKLLKYGQGNAACER